MNTLIQLTHYGLLTVEGKDANKFLQGQLTCDVNEISPTQTRLGAHCNPQGRVISLFRLYWLQDKYYLQMPRELLPIALASLKKYAVFFKVVLTDASDSLRQVGYQEQNLNTFSSQFPTEIDSAITLNGCIVTKIPGVKTRFQLIGPHEHEIWNQIADQAAEVSPQEWEQSQITAGIPSIYPETSEKFLPHELNLPKLNGVNFKKGCYTGQEIIARMEYRGKLKNHLYHARINSSDAPQRGGDIYRQKDRCGSIVDYCQVGYNEFELLVITSENDISTTVSLEPEQKTILKFE